jgi:ABC-type antimicrobial peptide transport system permease subunit
MLFFAVLMLVAAVLLIVTLLGSRLVSEARELTLLQVAGLTPGRLALLIAAEHALLAVVGAAAGILVAIAVAPRIAESAATVFGSVTPRLSLGDVAGVGAAAVAVSVLVSAAGGLRAGRRSLAVVARGGGVDVDPGAAQRAQRAPRPGRHHRPARGRLRGQPGRPGHIGTLIGVPLGLGVYLLFKAMAGGGFTGTPPPLAIVLVALGAVAVAAAAGAIPALLAQRVPASQALAAE